MANLDGIIRDLQQERDRPNAAIDALISIRSTSRTGRTIRRMSAAARRRIAAAQKARWAKRKGGSKIPKSTRPKRHTSAAGLARIRAAARARWAKVRAGKKVSV